MPAIVSHAQRCARKGFACILVDFRDLQLCHFLIGKRDNDGLRVCDFNILMVIFVQDVALRRHFLRHRNRAGHVLNRNLAAAVCDVMPNRCSVHLDLEHRARKPFLRAFVHLQNLQIRTGCAGCAGICRCARCIRRIWQVGYCPICAVWQFGP